MRRFTGLWRQPDFMKLWAGETISYLGSTLMILPLTWTAVAVLEVSATQNGLLNALKNIPFFLAFFAGVWVDRRRRRPVMIVSNVGRALAIGLIPIAAALGWLRFEVMCVAVLLIGILQVLFDTAYQSYFPSLVERGHLVEGNSKMFATQSFGEAAGPALAGFLIRLITAPFTLAVAAFTFLFSAVMAWSIKKPEVAPAPAAPGGNIWKDIGEGFKVIHKNGYLRAVVGEAATFNLFYSGALAAVFAIYAIRLLDMSSVLMGLFPCAAALGVLIGAVLAGWLAKKIGLGMTILWAMIFGCLAPAAYAIVNPSMNFPTIVAILLGADFLTGMAAAVANIHVVSLRQTIVPDNLLGRVNATYRTYIYGAVPIGSLLGGILADSVGVRAGLVIACAGLATGILWVLFSPVPRLKTMPTEQISVDEPELKTRAAESAEKRGVDVS